jgi:inner membrane protein
MLDNIVSLDQHWLWLSLAVLLGAAELVAPGFFLIWIAAAALITGIAAYFGAALGLQLGLFAILSVAAVYAGKRWFSVNPIESSDPMLNDRSARMVGQIGTVEEDVDANGGRVKLGDSVWPARGEIALSGGTRVRITAVNAGVLHVAAAD